jgi:hypothetical protein
VADATQGGEIQSQTGNLAAVALEICEALACHPLGPKKAAAE